MTETRNDIEASPVDKPVLSYGRQSRPTWHQWALRLIVVVSLVAAAWQFYPRIYQWFEMRAAIREVSAWHQQARTFVIPPGTLLYSENPADFPLGQLTTARRGAYRRTYVTLTLPYPLLRQLGYDDRGIPVLAEFDVLFVHEREMWHMPGRTKKYVVSVGYYGLDDLGAPSFHSMAMDLGNGQPPFPSMGGSFNAREIPTRSMANLRIYAGIPDPNDATRFALPFESDGGLGRFEFQMDNDVTDGGRISPDVRIAWDDEKSPTTSAGNEDRAEE